MLLENLEQALASAKLWQMTPIDPQLLQSTQPFCCDTLQFEQWLQFVFIPKMLALIAQDLPLPSNIALTPMAQMTLRDQANYKVILRVLESIDNSLSKGDIC
ncbi:YqcC family protein [Pseudoalteromonas sp. S16_S37]|nr:YqcC family protein [Pseudoalteromonas sp. S16_S37]MBD1584312.1 YqcC family protein [Pseudoalteromonas sp. S16_S37]